MSPQLYPTPPNPIDPDSNSNDGNIDESTPKHLQQSQPQSFVSKHRWPMFLGSYLLLGGLLSLPNFQKRLQPRTASLVRATVLGFAVLGGVGLSASELLEHRRSKEAPVVTKMMTTSFDEMDPMKQLSEDALKEKRRLIEEGGMQRD